MYHQTQVEFETFDHKEIAFWIREDTNDWNTIHSIVTDNEYLVNKMSYVPNDCFCDIGAHIGGWTHLMETLVPHGSFIAVEPIPENVELLRKNTNAKIFSCAVGKRDGEIVPIFYGDDSESGQHHKFIGTQAAKVVGAHFSSRTEAVYVSTVSLDTLLTDWGKCRVLKIDCEGTEYDLLEGASEETLDKIDFMIGEYHHVDEKHHRRQHLFALVEKQFDDISLEEDKPKIGHFWFRNKRLR